jgi:hypothetical protein
MNTILRTSRCRVRDTHSTTDEDDDVDDDDDDDPDGKSHRDARVPVEKRRDPESKPRNYPQRRGASDVRWWTTRNDVERAGRPTMDDGIDDDDDDDEEAEPDVDGDDGRGDDGE